MPPTTTVLDACRVASLALAANLILLGCGPADETQAIGGATDAPSTAVSTTSTVSASPTSITPTSAPPATDEATTAAPPVDGGGAPPVPTSTIAPTVEAQRTRWHAVKPASYTIGLWVPDTSGESVPFGQGCPATDELRVVVQDDQPVDIVNLLRNCVPAEDADVPTIDRLFDLAAEAAGVTGATIRYDDEWYLPTYVSAADGDREISAQVDWFVPTAVPLVRDDAVIAAVLPNRSTWDAHGPDSYSFTLRYAVSNLLNGTYRIQVINGEPVHIERLDGQAFDEDRAREMLPLTVEDVFDALGANLSMLPDTAMVGFHPDLGYPTDFRIDHVAAGIDDEFALAVRVSER